MTTSTPWHKWPDEKPPPEDSNEGREYNIVVDGRCRFVTSGRWDGDCYWYDSEGDEIKHVTHWAELPPLPEDGE